MYDARLGRMFSTDPLEGNYPGQSPYAYCGNSPISSIDINGEGDIDPRIARAGPQWNPKPWNPKPFAGATSSGNGINMTGGGGSTSSTNLHLSNPTSPSKFGTIPLTRINSVSFRLGNSTPAYGPKGLTSTWGIYGKGPTYYNTGIKPSPGEGPFTRFDEPAYTFQAQFGLSGGNRELGINITKLKMNSFSNGFKDDAATGFEVGAGFRRALWESGNGYLSYPIDQLHLVC